MRAHPPVPVGPRDRPIGRPRRLLACLAAIVGLATWRNLSQVNLLFEEFLPSAAVNPFPPEKHASGESELDFGGEFPSEPVLPITSRVESGDSGVPTLAPPSLKFLHMDNLSHFLSHIPKAGCSYAHDELTRLLLSSTYLPDRRTLQNVRDAQNRFDRRRFSGDFFMPQADHVSLPANLTSDAGSDAFAPPLVCNHGTTTLERLHPYYLAQSGESMIRYRCVMHVTEQPWTAAARHTYTIIREPLSHVLSQYFHCTESPQHRRSGQGRMPPLDEWLETYAELKESDFDEKEKRRRAQIFKQAYKCYNPIDSESEFTAFDRQLPKGYTYPYPDNGDHNGRDKAMRRLDGELFESLERRYRIIGDMAQMVKTLCAIFISFAGHVPEVCDCTEQSADSSGHNSSTFCLPNLYTHPDGPRNTLQCPVRMGYDSGKHAHGVQNHGSSVLKEITERQRELISDLRSRDLVLYNVSRAVFAKQVAALEAQHKIRICNQWNRHEGTWTVLDKEKRGARYARQQRSKTAKSVKVAPMRSKTLKALLSLKKSTKSLS